MSSKTLTLRRPYVFQASTTETTTTPGVTVIPNKPDSTKWIEDNPILVAVIIIGAFLLILAFVLAWICYKRRTSRKGDVCRNDKEGESETTPAPHPERKKKSVDLYSDSFVIIQSPSLSKRREKKRKQSVAVHPLFSVNHRKPSRPNNQQRRATIHFAKWSEEGLEIHAAGELSNKQRARAQSTASNTSGKATEAGNLRRPSVPEVGTSTSTSTSAPCGVPVYYRRVSLGPHHAIFAPGTFKNGQDSD